MIELYRRHKELTDKIDWSYHEFLPWELGKNFKTHPYEPGQGTLSDEIYLAVETALLTEVNLPWFTSGLSDTFRGSLEVLQDFVHTWTSEEDQHSSLLHTYLLLTRNGDPKRIHTLRKETIQEGWLPDMHSPVEVMVYTTIQELATQVFYLNVAKAAEKQDPHIAIVLRQLAKDETLHYDFYRKAVKAHLEINPNYVWPVADVMLEFQMPGASMPNFKERMQTIALHAGYGPAQFYRQVIEVLAKYWDLDNLHPTYPEARAALDKIIHHRKRLERLAERNERQQLSRMDRDALRGGRIITGE